jgi:hypothetical protein
MDGNQEEGLRRKGKRKKGAKQGVKDNKVRGK